ncbi:MAG: hypothetical protein IMZ61_06580 [Planctomycetes bacterium]|nr:hypothetical protein [Planctomycetota bacterium]
MYSSLNGFPMTPLTPEARPMDMSGTAEYAQYAVSTTQYHGFGRRLLTGNGKVFKFGKSNAEWRTGLLAFFGVAIPAAGIDYSLLPAAASAGATSIQMTNQGTVAQTLNCLAGGHIVMKLSTADTGVSATLQQRDIVGNTAGGVSDVITIYLDAPITTALTTASYAFAMPSHWSSVGYGLYTKRSAAGLPATYVSAANYFGWLQTWGPAWVSDIAATLGTVAYQRQLVLGYAGGVGPHIYDAGNAQDQHIGFIMDNNEADNGATNIFLQLTPV